MLRLTQLPLARGCGFGSVSVQSMIQFNPDESFNRSLARGVLGMEELLAQRQHGAERHGEGWLLQRLP